MVDKQQIDLLWQFPDKQRKKNRTHLNNKMIKIFL